MSFISPLAGPVIGCRGVLPFVNVGPTSLARGKPTSIPGATRSVRAGVPAFDIFVYLFPIFLPTFGYLQVPSPELSAGGATDTHVYFFSKRTNRKLP
ncbi:hypothetical protein LSAT2_023040 [Lamellibrachia satsuma]|nr:hypothetical protein LSAT2_023040 [Lamellibrachia satsuma]